MRPDPSRALEGVATALLTALAAEVRTPFGQSQAQIAGVINAILAHELDGLADRLASENTAVSAILREALPLLDRDVARAVEDALALVPPDIRVSSLQRVNDALRAALVDAHAAVESLPVPEASAVNERIWDELRESTRRRHIEVGR